jgi:NTP pyrophosphatase (non-canonical NTP hydrolase)
MTSTKEIFEHIRENRKNMTYKDACKILNDLAFVLIPFDKTKEEFLDLIFQTKSLLKEQRGPVKYYDLLESV